jgi:hypothetical protein
MSEQAQNEAGNDGCSVTVGLPNGSTDLGLENARRYFIAQRQFEGADTPIGHRWSNLVELSQAIYGSTDQDQREHCTVSFAKNLCEILDLKLNRPPRMLSRQQLMLAYSTNTFH